MSSQNPGCLGFLFQLFGANEAEEQKRLPDKLPYRIRDDFLSAAELSLYGVLRLAVGDRWAICPKVRLADIFFAVGEQAQAWNNRTLSKHVDFLLCDARTMRPVLAVELDDRSHTRPHRQQRDEFEDRLFRSAGLPLVRMTPRANYSVDEVAAALRNAIAPTSPPVARPTAAAQAAPATTRPGTVPICPKCGVPMVLRQSKKDGNRFYGCPNFPRCRHTAPAPVR